MRGFFMCLTRKQLRFAYYRSLVYTFPTMVNRMRATRSHRNNRRSHHALAGGALSKCKECGQQKMAHQVCPNCGKYNGRVVVNVNKKAEKKAKKSKEKETAR
ncbi:MAG: 50S ribosomal protein L32 [Candidatus Paceibacterota bacterium]